MNKLSQRYIGLMSGTSVDAVDAALIEVTDERIRLIDFIDTPIPEKLQEQLITLNRSQQIELQQLCSLEKELGNLFSVAVQQLLASSNFNAKDISAIGSHGQTIFHAPEIPMTLQIGHPAFIAKQTGITTVSDFRVDDMALGGQGAPFAPVFHQQLFAGEKPCIVVNIGGIANLSYLPEKGSQANIVGWDTGPGNGLMDDVCQQQLQQRYDKDGQLAAQGESNPLLLNALLQHSYFTEAAPKSTGRDTFNIQWVNAVVSEQIGNISNTDLLATLAELTAITIVDQIKLVAKSDEDIWIVGGGAFNHYLLQRIQSLLPEHLVKSSAEIGIDPNAVEAMLCAWLANQRMYNKAVGLSAVTGAQRNAVLGGIWHP